MNDGNFAQVEWWLFERRGRRWELLRCYLDEKQATTVRKLLARFAGPGRFRTRIVRQEEKCS